MIADPKLPGRISAATEGFQYDDFGDPIIKTAESVIDLVPDLVDSESLKSLQSAAKGLGSLPVPTSLIDIADTAKELSGEINLTKQKLDDVVNQALGNLTTSAATLAPLMQSKSVEALGQLRKSIPQIPQLPNINFQDQIGELLSGKLDGLDVASQLLDIRSKFGEVLTNKGIDLDNLVDSLSFAANPNVLTQLGEMDNLIDNMKSKINILGNPLGKLTKPFEIFQDINEDLSGEISEQIKETIDSLDRIEIINIVDEEIKIPAINKESLKSLKNGLASQVGQMKELKNKLTGLIGKGGGDISDMISKVVPNLQILPNGDVVEKAKKSLLAAVDSIQEQATPLNLNPNIVLITKKFANNIAAFPTPNGQGKIVFDDIAKKVKLEISTASEQVSSLNIPDDFNDLVSSITKQMKSVDGEIVKFSQALSENNPSIRKNVQEQINNFPIELSNLFSAGQNMPIDTSSLSGLADLPKFFESAIDKIQPKPETGVSRLKNSAPQTTIEDSIKFEELSDKRLDDENIGGVNRVYALVDETIVGS
tara:strand:- start:1006 stop:2619 length:1614 start_codon:yes stop_codon:yes gene_type:complete